MIGISVIGTPNAFEILSGGIAKNLPIEPKVDLQNSLINVFPNSDILMARREVEGKNIYFYFVYYRFATEMSTSRPGSYYGSAVVLKNHGVPQSDLIKALRDLADVVKKLHPKISANEKYLMMEFLLHGLSEFSLLSKNNLVKGLRFKDLFSSVFNNEKDS